MNNAVLYEERGRVAVITLNRPDALNTFTPEVGALLCSTLTHAGAAAVVRAVVLTGAGRGFSAGAELSGTPPTSAETVRILEECYGRAVRLIGELPKPVVAAVNGFAVGVGLSVALACDLVYMGETAFLESPFARIGLVPDGGLCWQLSEQLGPRLAFELAVEGERIHAAKCIELRLVNRVVADNELMTAACAAAERLANVAPLALAGTKRLVRRAQQLGLEGTMREEALEQACCIASADCREGVAAFLEKRAPRFTGM